MNLAKNGIGLVAAAAAAAVTAVAVGQPSGNAPAAPTVRASGNPQRDTLFKLQRPVGIELSETRLEDVLKYISETTGAPFEVQWKTDREDGFERDALVTMSVKDMPAIMFLEKVLLKITAETGNDSTWQLTPLGVVQIGTKDRLNKFKRIEIYDINDLLFVMPIYTEAPEIDLQQVLQNSGGGGRGGGGSSGQSPFKQNQGKNRDQENEKSKEDRAKDVINLITQFVETAQWTDSGGEGGQIRYYQGHIIVEGPDYMHRGVNGYPWWPQIRTSVSGGKRYVSLNLDTSVSKIDSLTPFPVSGGVGGVGGRPPGGPG